MTVFHFEPGPNRERLGFKEAVLKNFRFLRRYHFRCVRAEPTFVRYETALSVSRKKVFVNVYHGRGSYQMGVEIGRNRDEGLMLPLPWIVKWAGGPEEEEFEKRTMFQASSRESVDKLMPNMAALVQKYAVPFLRGDEQAYARAWEEMRREGVLYSKEMRLRQARDRAEAAWHTKDYEQVVRVYEPVEEDLTKSESMRLQYARKQLTLSEAATHGASASRSRS